MFPPSFLGARSDALIDIVILSLAIIVPIILYSWQKVRARAYLLHKRIQVTLCIVLFLVVALFEYDLRLQGGIFAMVKGSRFEGTTFLNGSIYLHTFLAITTSLIWLWLTAASWFKFPTPPRPARFSKTHKLWGKIGMIDMILTGVTGVQLYIFGFYL